MNETGPAYKELEYKVRLMSDTPPNETVFVLGATGCGKTTLMANLVSNKPRFVILDVKDDYDPKFFPRNAVVNDPQMLLRAMNEGHRQIIYKFKTLSEPEEELNSVLQAIWLFQQRNHKVLPPIYVCMDELNRFAKHGQCPEYLAQHITMGRSFNIRKIFGAQWFNTIPTWCRESFSEIWVFRHTETNGLAMLADYGFDAEDIRVLPVHTCLHMAKGEIERVKLVVA